MGEWLQTAHIRDGEREATVASFHKHCSIIHSLLEQRKSLSSPDLGERLG